MGIAHVAIWRWWRWWRTPPTQPEVVSHGWSIIARLQPTITTYHNLGDHLDLISSPSFWWLSWSRLIIMVSDMITITLVRMLLMMVVSDHHYHLNHHDDDNPEINCYKMVLFWRGDHQYHDGKWWWLQLGADIRVCWYSIRDPYTLIKGIRVC